MTDLKDDDECQPGSQHMPELQGELVGRCAPGRRSVVSVPAVSELTAVLQLPHVKHRQAAVHITSQAPEPIEEKINYHTTTSSAPPDIFDLQAAFFKKRKKKKTAYSSV